MQFLLALAFTLLQIRDVQSDFKDLIPNLYYLFTKNPISDHKDSIDETEISLSELIHFHGYPVEEYIITTADGYILKIQRLHYGTNTKIPVLIQHGILSTAYSWVSNYPNKNLPYLLADAGYDVWLGSHRGTPFGRNHSKLNPSNGDFWDFSFQEIAEYDLPAIINRILNETGCGEMFYIGHSQGTTTMFALLSMQPKYNKIVKAFFALAPSTNIQHVKSGLRFFFPFTNLITWSLNKLGMGEFTLGSYLFQFIKKVFCLTSYQTVCNYFVSLVSGYNPNEIDTERLPLILSHWPVSTSNRNIIHLLQIINSGKFQKYDYGNENIIHYAQENPPEFNLSKISTKLILFWSKNDLIVTPEDVSWLATKLNNIVLNYCVPSETFSHLDFMWGKHAMSLVYAKLLELMKEF